MNKLILILCLPAFLITNVMARNIDLSTVPERTRVQLTIYNSEDLTLVRETRHITFKKGINPLQFSWANTLIDPTSVELQFTSHQTHLELIETSYPHDKPQMLYWQVQSDKEIEAAVEINYFTSGIHWRADYLALADKDEKNIHLHSFVHIANHSGEDYENAQVRLVVGVINLVEKIAHLAQHAGRTPEISQQTLRAKTRAMKDAMMENEVMAPAPMLMAEMSVGTSAPKEITKESLSEYFIYTIEGTETIPTGWEKRLRSFEVEQVPVTVHYRYRPQEYGAQPVRLYILRNHQESGLGLTPLPEGIIRIFRDNGHNGLKYVGQQTLKYVPIGDKIELNLGSDPEVIFELLPKKVYRDNIWMHIIGTDVYQKVGGRMNIELNSSVAGWDEHMHYIQRIRNYSTKALHIEIRHSYDGDIVWRSLYDAALHDYRTVQFEAQIDTGATMTIEFEVIRREGYNHKKNNIEILHASPQ
jgi:hypothetical protein